MIGESLGVQTPKKKSIPVSKLTTPPLKNDEQKKLECFKLFFFVKLCFL